MEELTPYEIKILKKLSKSTNGFSDSEIEDMFDKEANTVLYKLYNKKIVEIKYRQEDIDRGIFIPCGNWIISDYGKSCLIQQKSIVRRSNRQKWEDRIWSFLFGLISGIAIGLILGLFNLSS